MECPNRPVCIEAAVGIFVDRFRLSQLVFQAE